MPYIWFLVIWGNRPPYEFSQNISFLDSIKLLQYCRNKLLFCHTILAIYDWYTILRQGALIQPAFTCPKLKIETLEQGVKYAQS